MKENPYLELRHLIVLAARGEIEPEEYGKRWLETVNKIILLEGRLEEKQPKGNVWAKVYDKDGNKVKGNVATKANLMYRELVRARAMMEKTTGEEQKRWIQTRIIWNKKLIEEFPEYRVLPGLSTAEIVADPDAILKKL
ncbi:MAG: hypothetical protein KAW19_06750 [Candidatus Aminicenantes bacterium]|nr:hypothetical protein [Candidatus Aminicenantes bacterium]